MPYITVKLMEGRSNNKKRDLIRRISEVAAEILNTEEENIRIELLELQEGNFAIGGKIIKKKND